MKLSDYAKNNNITYRTAYRHWKQGLIKGKQLVTGTIVLDENVTNIKSYAIYARVSSYDQKEDLKRQLQRIRDFCSSRGIIIEKEYSEIASGVNDKRPKLLKILNSDYSIIVEHKDRLTRFGFNYIETLLNKQKRDILILNNMELKDDLVKDFNSVITSFCVKIYGKRRSKRKKEEILKQL